MRDYDLGFISNEKIYEHTKMTVNQYRFAIDLASFNSNLVDPIKLTFDAKIYDRPIDKVIEDEALRQIDKSNTNHIGYFHQNIFHYISNKWSVPTEGYDVINSSENIYVEMKNKHNTMNSSSTKTTYMRMKDTVTRNAAATCYLVEVIAKDSQNIPWKVSIDKVKMSDPKIRRISIDKFYEMTTGDSLAFKKLCEKLPMIIEDIISDGAASSPSNTVVEELKVIDHNLLQTLYLTSFKNYQGFNNFSLQINPLALEASE